VVETQKLAHKNATQARKETKNAFTEKQHSNTGLQKAAATVSFLRIIGKSGHRNKPRLMLPNKMTPVLPRFNLNFKKVS